MGYAWFLVRFDVLYVIQTIVMQAGSTLASLYHYGHYMPLTCTCTTHENLTQPPIQMIIANDLLWGKIFAHNCT